MARNAHTDFDIPHVLLRMGAASEMLADQLALQIEAETKKNIQQNGQIDTGFMLNSTYTVSKKRNTHDQARGSGKYTSAKTGQSVRRDIAPPVRLPSDALAACAVGAEYAIYQEVKKSFLFAAAQTVGKMSGSKVREMFLEHLTD